MQFKLRNNNNNSIRRTNNSIRIVFPNNHQTPLNPRCLPISIPHISTNQSPILLLNPPFLNPSKPSANFNPPAISSPQSKNFHCVISNGRTLRAVLPHDHSVHIYLISSHSLLIRQFQSIAKVLSYRTLACYDSKIFYVKSTCCTQLNENDCLKD